MAPSDHAEALPTCCQKTVKRAVQKVAETNEGKASGSHWIAEQKTGQMAGLVQRHLGT